MGGWGGGTEWVGWVGGVGGYCCDYCRMSFWSWS